MRLNPKDYIYLLLRRRLFSHHHSFAFAFVLLLVLWEIFFLQPPPCVHVFSFERACQTVAMLSLGSNFKSTCWLLLVDSKIKASAVYGGTRSEYDAEIYLYSLDIRTHRISERKLETFSESRKTWRLGKIHTQSVLSMFRGKWVWQ